MQLKRYITILHKYLLMYCKDFLYIYIFSHNSTVIEWKKMEKNAQCQNYINKAAKPVPLYGRFMLLGTKPR